jgi:hypothetical protein
MDVENNRLNDMLERYGEVCTQKVAAQLLNVVPRTISRMMDEGRLRRVDRRVDVRSICEYIENPKKGELHGTSQQYPTQDQHQSGGFSYGSAYWQMGTQKVKEVNHG